MTVHKKAKPPASNTAAPATSRRGRNAAAKADAASLHGEPLPKNPVPLADRLGLPPKEVAHERSKSLAAPSEPITMRMPARGLELARAIAEKKGLPYQTYLKSLIHEGLERDRAILG